MAGNSEYKIDSIYSPLDYVKLKEQSQETNKNAKDRSNSSTSYLSTKECSDQRMQEENRKDFTQIMFERWQKMN